MDTTHPSSLDELHDALEDYAQMLEAHLAWWEQATETERLDWFITNYAAESDTP